ncbi:MAG: hypothetical protein PHP50_07330 [Lachnospiraceae bacterium]|nr:hypothetical protein [Lachnospiraceae bacterium]
MKSELGAGSTFSVYFDLEIVSAEEAKRIGNSRENESRKSEEISMANIFYCVRIIL